MNPYPRIAPSRRRDRANWLKFSTAAWRLHYVYPKRNRRAQRAVGGYPLPLLGSSNNGMEKTGSRDSDSYHAARRGRPERQSKRGSIPPI